MYAPAPPAPPLVAAAPLTAVEIAGGTPSPGEARLIAPPAGAGIAASVSLAARRPELNVLAGHAATIPGALLADLPADPRSAVGLSGRVIALQARGARGWSTIASTRAGRSGRFRVRFIPRRLGSELVRLRFAGDLSDRPTSRRLGRLNVYRLAEASWYGGGGGLACGGQLTSTTMGVANKTLPCGTEVTLRYHGRTVRVPVIDRGPYVAGREFDLTEATKQALGFGDTGQVWSTR
ncbi:MAG TPA: septal ring lytic transglycosylase RlpA family protein [Solirubrobacteraceae bacterium]|nr:septal ring lytic transglycosylase RlpA family protein [Solirubrobacteraceae bacterium]